MEVDLQPGKYVVAVSGGVDSMVLLDLLARNGRSELTIAHFEHGIRPDSDQDRRLVQSAAKQYGLPFVYAQGNLGPDASEAVARAARYKFLQQVRAEQAAQSIVTAHHQDDVLETAMINLLRGTGLRGLGSVRSTAEIARPLLAIPKKRLLSYALEHNVRWREDSTNQNDRYLRNYLRRRIMPRLTPAQRADFLRFITTAQRLDDALADSFASQLAGTHLDRQWFAALPYALSTDAMARWLRQHRLPFNHKAVHRLTVFAKTASAGKAADVDVSHVLRADKRHITLMPR